MTKKISGKVFNFKDQMCVGDRGEAEFIKIYKKKLNPVKSVDDRKIDFTLNNGYTVELKTDSYSMEKTKNFFMEKNTVLPDGKDIPGGPWRSLKHKVDRFVYYYITEKSLFWFDPKVLCDFLDNYIKENKLKPIPIPNKDSTGKPFHSYGYKIPRSVITEAKICLFEDKVKTHYKIVKPPKEP
jgi:hypothetical protein